MISVYLSYSIKTFLSRISEKKVFYIFVFISLGIIYYLNFIFVLKPISEYVNNFINYMLKSSHPETVWHLFCFIHIFIGLIIINPIAFQIQRIMDESDLMRAILFRARNYNVMAFICQLLAISMICLVLFVVFFKIDFEPFMHSVIFKHSFKYICFMILLFLLLLSTINIKLCVRLWLRTQPYGETLNIVIEVVLYSLYSWAAWIVYRILKATDIINNKKTISAYVIQLINQVVVYSRQKTMVLYLILGFMVFCISVKKLGAILKANG